jgi:hypothetical protein
MGLYVTEFVGPPPDMPHKPAWPPEPALQTSVLSSGSTGAGSTLSFNAATKYVRLATDAVAHYCLFSLSTSVLNPTSTQAERIPPNTVEFRFVNTGGTGPGKLVEFST